MAKIHILEKFPQANAMNGARTTDKISIVKGHMNKVLFVFPRGYKSLVSLMNSNLSIKHVSDRVTNLVTKMPFQIFMDISDEKFGSTNNASTLARMWYNTASNHVGSFSGEDVENIGDNLEQLLDDFLVDNQNDFNTTISVLVDLGSFQLVRGDEVHIEFEKFGAPTLGTNSTVIHPEYEVYSVSDEPTEAHHMLTYDTDTDVNELHKNVISLYIENKNAEDKIDIYVDSETVQYQTTKAGATAYAMLTGRFENTIPQTIKVYDNDLPEDVQLKVVGSEGTFKAIAVRMLTDIASYEEQQRTALLLKAKQVENVEKNQPDVANVLLASGVVPSSSSLENKAQEFKK